MSPRDKDRWRFNGATIGKVAVAGGGVTLITIGALLTIIGTHSTLPGTGVTAVRLELIAGRDLGALPERISWCTLGRAAEHCYDLQQTSGNATDLGTGSWDLTPTGLRAGVVTSVPTRNATGWVDWTSELATWGDGAAASGLVKASATPSATDVLSVTFMGAVHEDGALGALVAHRDSVPPQKGWFIYMPAAGNIAGSIDYGPGVISVSGSTDLRGAWHCVTVVLDARTANQGRVYVNGSDDTVGGGDISVASGGFTAVAPFRIHGMFDSASFASRHGLSRVRFDEGYATSLAEHQEFCGDVWQAPAGGVDDDKPLAADATWIQTGGPKCYPSSPSTAICVPGGLQPYTVDATGYGWPVEPDATNRVLYNTAIDCTNWTCSGTAAATPLEVAPDGSATATLLDLANGDVVASPTTTGYADGETLYPRVWVKCSAGSLWLLNSASSAGAWAVDCSQIGGVWAGIYSASQAAVTELNPWVARTAAADSWRFYGNGAVAVTVWMPTLTEEPGIRVAAIPTGNSAVSTGDPAWTIDNTGGKYWLAGDTVLQSLTQISGTCWLADATTIRLSGPAGSECTGIWYGVQVTP
jgi:hypothetical protein